MLRNLFLAIGSAWVAIALWTGPRAHLILGWGFVMVALWQLFTSVGTATRRDGKTILRLGGFRWSRDEFCRGWLITGQIGTGKTAAAINSMMWQLTKTCPDWGGVCVDDKGLYWETLSKILRHFGRQEDLVLLQVRPVDALPGWKPAHTFNFLDDPHLPYSAKAKIICDVATSLGQRTDQAFFRMQAQIQMEWAFKALQVAGWEVTLDQACSIFVDPEILAKLLARLEAARTPEACALIKHHNENFKKQPPEQLGGVKTTVTNYLEYFTDPCIAEVFCPWEPGIKFDEIDRGKKICVSLPQRYQVERRYINTLLKLAFYMHALRRFDRPAHLRTRDNVIVLWADEAQKIVTASDDAISDYNVVDVIREARATVVAATQSYASLIPPMAGDERKAKVFIANMANRITFSAADEDSAKIAADTIGKRKAKRRTFGFTAGKRTSSWTEENRYWFEPFELRKLRQFEAVVQHCNGCFRKAKLPPRGPDGKVPAWYRN